MRIILIILCILALDNSRNVYARENFSETFDNGAWQIIQQSPGTTWYLKEGKLYSESAKNSASLYQAPVGELENFTFEIDVSNENGVDMPFLLRHNDSLSSYYLLGLRYVDSNWPQDCNEIVLWKSLNGNLSLLKSIKPDVIIKDFILTKNVTRKLKVSVLENRIRVWIDNDLFIDVVDENPIPRGKLALYSWGGEFNSGLTKNIYDNFKLVSGEGQKYIVIPGLGASWNSDALVYNKTVDSSDWKMTPFVHNYDGLTKLLQDNNLKKDEDFWVWNYDWRKPVEEIQTDLNSFINEKVGAEEELNIIGHSLGGLTARVWYQNNRANRNIDKIITLGSPHRGAVQAYEAWEGALVGNSYKAADIGMNMLVTMQSKYDETRVGTIRRIAPVLKDLMPTENYIKSQNKVISWDNLVHKNEYLKVKNSAIPQLMNSGKVVTIASPMLPTKNWVNVQQPSVFEQKLGYWSDGKPVGYKYSSGDDTVLYASANLDETTGLKVVSNHDDIVDSSLQLIAKTLGLGNTQTVPELNNDLKDKIILFIGSPAYIRSMCGGIEYKSDEFGFLILDRFDFEGCKIELVGTQDGVYHLVVGAPGTKQTWLYEKGEIKKDEAKQVDVLSKNGELDFSKDMRWNNIQKMLKELYKWYSKKDVDSLLSDCLAKKTEALTNKLFTMRKSKVEYEFSNKVLDELLKIFTEELSSNSVEANNLIRRISQQKSLADTMARINLSKGMLPSTRASSIYGVIEEIENKTNTWKVDKKYNNIKAASYFVDRYSKELWL